MEEADVGTRISLADWNGNSEADRLAKNMAQAQLDFPHVEALIEI